MKKALLITFYFPPCGSSSTARNFGFAKHFKKFDIETIVLTPKEETFQKLPTVRADDSYERDLKDLRIIRTETLIPTWIIRMLFKLHLTRFLKVIFPFELHMFWFLPALLKGLKIAKNEKIDLIISTSLPNTSHLIGFALHKLKRIPWIADFQDPMGYGFGNVWFTRFSHKFVLYLEKFITGKATGITTQSETSREVLLEKYPSIRPEKIIAVTNAYDMELNTTAGLRTPAGKLRIVHSGEFYSHHSTPETFKTRIKSILTYPVRLFDYAPYKADLAPHSAFPLLNAVSEIIHENPESAEKIEVVLNGYINPKDKCLIDSLKIPNTIKITGMTSYAESLKIINSANLLYLPLFVDLARKRNYCIPGKLFPYMASLRPILAPIQNGDTRDILERSGLGILTAPNNKEMLKKALKDAIEDHLRGENRFDPDIPYIERFSRENTVRIMADFAKIVMGT